MKYDGKYTIDIEEDIIVNANDKVSIVVEFQSLTNQTVNIPIEINQSGKEGESYYSLNNGVSFEKLIKEGNARIKMLTTNIDQESDNILVESIELDETSTILEVNETKQLTPTVLPLSSTDQRLSYTSSNDVVKVENGLITALKTGTSIITIQSLSNPLVKVEYEVTVNAPYVFAQSLSLDKERLSMKVDDVTYLKASLLPLDTTD